jgi:signal transduction histidine kinase
MMAIFTSQLLEFEPLAAVPPTQLKWLEANSVISEYQSGEYVGKEGEKITGPHFLLEGEIKVVKKQGVEKNEISVFARGAIFGYLPYSRAQISTLSAQALGPVRLMTFDIARMREMISGHYELTQALVHHMNDRVRDYTTLQQQYDKMAALGKLAAGLAHEINNPAAALVSDSNSLRNHLRAEPEAFKKLTALHLDANQVDGANALLVETMASYSANTINLKERLKNERHVGRWLEDNVISNADEMSEIFVDFDFGVPRLELFCTFIPAHARDTVLNWVLNVLVTEKMVLDIQRSSERISELITSVKIYTHMDRGTEKILINIHEGINNTLHILGHKFRKGKIVLSTDFGHGVPEFNAYPGELNQVWTNLIDNALDSLEHSSDGRITIKTARDVEFIKVIVTDNGPGIPEDVINNIFDPFFTTKGVGKGTGMGLETVRRIIIKHKGTIKVHSEPNNTAFTVCLPIDTTITHYIND